MSKLQWAAVGTVLVFGIVLQIPRHDHGQMPGHDHPDHIHEQGDDIGPAMSAAVMQTTTAVPAGRERLLLNISGMT